MQRYIKQDVQAILYAHGTDITDEIRLAVLQSRLGRDWSKCPEVRSVADNEDILRIKATSGHGAVPVSAIGNHDDVAEAVGQTFQPHLGPVQNVLPAIFGKI